MIEKILPYKMYLSVFQLENYETRRFIKWVFRNYFVRKLENKKPLVWTFKAKTIYLTSIFYTIFLLIASFRFWGVKGLLVSIITATQSFLFLILARATLFPSENFLRFITRIKLRKKISALKAGNMKIIGITGSYGKTSVKEFLYQMLKTKYNTAKTPNSFNTVLGIAKIVDMELYNDCEFFVCEIGAYKKGEIEEICSVIQPDYAILTGINEQHLERFGSIENTIKAKFELVCATPKTNIILNGDDKLIMKSFEKYVKTPNFYGVLNNTFGAKNVKLKNLKTEFTLILDKKEFKTETTLIGRSNLSNIIAASAMAYILKVEPIKIVRAIHSLKPIPHRLEIKHPAENITIIDDSYNSNPSGFRAALELLKSFKGDKILATPGIVELGNRTKDIHIGLGKLSNEICDYVILIGKNERTIALKSAIEDNKVIFINTLPKLMNAIAKLKLKKPVILIENDLPDNY
ncbi:MAG: UDP-N-acetylmuramoyl-tripeptide--D-alanyl-D-alanine ligase [Patescibacteria group bacterium]|nr:UDP-N-acetylmuramoyl-tripeptide--D-alanyl-D-alanine ligase [Patescibacteria group bacterium]